MDRHGCFHRNFLAIFIIGSAFVIERNEAMVVGYTTPVEDQCNLAINEIINEDRATIVDESSTRLQATWISQECELRAGPEYLIRKYRFYENGTFLLMRHYYAEESCSIPTHTVTARGSIKLLDPSLLTPGATETKYTLDQVHVSPLNPQVTSKLETRVNSCLKFNSKWRPYEAQLIYERPIQQQQQQHHNNPRFSLEKMKFYEDPKHNKLQGHASKSTYNKKMKHYQKQQQQQQQRAVNCLQELAIDFDELSLVRVQKRPTHLRSATAKLSNGKARVELYFAGLPQDAVSKRNHRGRRPSSLQPTALIRTDTIHNCPACGIINSGSENRPPLLHEMVDLPAVLRGSWLSPNCESRPGGIYLRRQLRFYPDDRLWTGRWDYFVDARCSVFLYGITAAGSYVQRAIPRQKKHRRHDQHSRRHDERTSYINKRSTEESDYYRRLLQNAQPSMVQSFRAILRGNQRKEEESTTTKPSNYWNQPAIPSGTTDLDLHVAETFLITGNLALAKKCGNNSDRGTLRNLNTWPKNCVPHSLMAPSTISMKARIGTDWYGQLTLMLGPKNGLWEAPLQQCGYTDTKNPSLKSYLRRSIDRIGSFFMSDSLFESSSANTRTISVLGFVSSFAFCLLFNSVVMR